MASTSGCGDAVSHQLLTAAYYNQRQSTLLLFDQGPLDSFSDKRPLETPPLAANNDADPAAVVQQNAVVGEPLNVNEEDLYNDGDLLDCHRHPASLSGFTASCPCWLPLAIPIIAAVIPLFLTVLAIGSLFLAGCAFFAYTCGSVEHQSKLHIVAVQFYTLRWIKFLTLEEID